MRTTRGPQWSASPGRAARTALVAAAAVALAAGPALPSQASRGSSAAALCRHGGWQQLMAGDGTLFASPGACVAYGARGGTIVPRGGSPTAVDDTAKVGGNLSAVVAVLDNDLDPDGDALTVTILEGPADGTATVLADGTVRYTPALDFAGADSFSYRIDDGRGGSDMATVTLEVVESPVKVIAVSPEQIVSDITVQIMVIISALPAGHTVTEVRFRHGDDWVGLVPDATSIATRVPVTIPRLRLAAGTYDVAVLSSDGSITTAAVLPDGLTVLGP